MQATDPLALFTLGQNTLTVVGASLDAAMLDGGPIGSLIPATRRWVSMHKPPADDVALCVYLSRAYVGDPGTEQRSPMKPGAGAYGMHAAVWTVGITLPVKIIEGITPPTGAQMQADGRRLLAAGWAAFVALLSSLAGSNPAGTLVAPCGSVTIQPLVPGVVRGGFGTINTGVAIQI